MAGLAVNQGAAKEDTAVRPFELPTVEGVIMNHANADAIPTAQQLEDIHERAYQEGYDAGFKGGYEAGEERAAREFGERVDTLEMIIASLASPLASADQEVVETCAQLALVIARHIVRREIRLEPGEVIAAVRTALKHLATSDLGVQIRLNPDDIEIAREALAAGQDSDTYALEPDLSIGRGGCIVETPTSRIDATVEHRLAAIASTMFGGDRAGD